VPWTLIDNSQRDPGSENLTNDDWRLVRGGSWDFSPDVARAAFRDYDHPAYRLWRFRFPGRLWVASPFSGSLITAGAARSARTREACAEGAAKISARQARDRRGAQPASE
jgi:hypothetical protein